MYLSEWKQAGVMHLWRYDPEKPGIRGWHFTGDRQGLESVVALLRLLQGRPRVTSRQISLTQPSDRTIRGPFSPIDDRKVTTATSLQLVTDPELSEEFWEMKKDGGSVDLRLGVKSLVDLREGFETLIETGIGDFSVGPSKGRPGQNIWFW